MPQLSEQAYAAIREAEGEQLAEFLKANPTFKFLEAVNKHKNPAKVAADQLQKLAWLGERFERWKKEQQPPEPPKAEPAADPALDRELALMEEHAGEQHESGKLLAAFADDNCQLGHLWAAMRQSPLPGSALVGRLHLCLGQPNLTHAQVRKWYAEAYHLEENEALGSAPALSTLSWVYVLKAPDPLRTVLLETLGHPSNCEDQQVKDYLEKRKSARPEEAMTLFRKYYRSLEPYGNIVPNHKAFGKAKLHEPWPQLEVPFDYSFLDEEIEKQAAHSYLEGEIDTSSLDDEIKRSFEEQTARRTKA